MALRLAEKKAIVADVAGVASNAASAIAADYRGMTVAEMTELRTKAREANVYARVVPNTLARRAVTDTSFACLQEALVGPIILMFSHEDPGAAARLVRDFCKNNQKLEVKALSLGGALLESTALKAVADLPTYGQAIAMLMSVMQAPIIKLVRTLAEPHAKLTRLVAAIGEKKQTA